MRIAAGGGTVTPANRGRESSSFVTVQLWIALFRNIASRSALECVLPVQASTPM
jgi:hypothetical protein